MVDDRTPEEMTLGSLPYGEWIEEALRDVVRRALTHASEYGLPDEHHFYVTFRTDADGVAIPSYLRALHPAEMTIVLQHQFWNLGVGDEGFAVSLKFRGKQERLEIPFAAITQFADPSVNFGLQLKLMAASVAGRVPGAKQTGGEAREDKKEGEEVMTAAEDDGAQVIALDTFRKK